MQRFFGGLFLSILATLSVACNRGGEITCPSSCGENNNQATNCLPAQEGNNNDGATACPSCDTDDSRTDGEKESVYKSKRIYFMKPPGWAGACIRYWGTAPNNYYTDERGLEMNQRDDGYYFYELVDQKGANIQFNSCDGRYSSKARYWEGDLWVYSDNVWYDRQPELADDTVFSVTPYPPVPGERMTIKYRGTLKYPGLKARVRFNGGQNLTDGNLTRFNSSEYYLDGDYYKDYYAADSSSDAAEFDVYVPFDTRAITVTFWGNNGIGEVKDDNFGEYYAVSVLPIYMGPYLTFASPEADKGTSIMVHYVTDKPMAAQVEYGLTPDLGESTEMVKNERYHHRLLSNLIPGTKYYYRIKRADGLVSKTYNFVTPAPNDHTDFTFMVAGDMQDRANSGFWGPVAKQMNVVKDKFDFIVSTGDLVIYPDTDGYWIFFDRGREILAQKVFMVAMGNHDSPLYFEKDYFRFLNLFPPLSGGSGSYYNFTYQGALFILLNAAMTEDFQSDGVQYNYTNMTIEQAFALRNPSWSFHFMHIPLYNAGAAHAWESPVYRPLINSWNNHLDWSFGGHEHFYQRHDIVNGTGYIAVPAAGNWPRTELVEPDNDAFPNKNWQLFPGYPENRDGEGKFQTPEPSEDGFVLVKLDDNNIQIDTYFCGYDGNPNTLRIVDSYSHSK